MSVTRSDFNPTPPPPGYMVLFDAITPPLNDGDYKLEVSTAVQYTGSQGSDGSIAPQERYFSIDGPRFTIPATMVGGVFPPRNGHGSYEENMPHIALARRTLPWERDPNLPNPQTAADPNALDPAIPTPWLALLLFEDGECTVTQNVPIRQVVGDAIWNALGGPQGTCDQVSAPFDLVQSIMPTAEELKLLTHVRQVNVDYKELSAGSSDGFFSVVMSNRLPEPNKSYRACLISMEQRGDLLPVEAPESEDAQIGGIIIAPGGGVVHGAPGVLAAGDVAASPSFSPSPGASHELASISAAAGHAVAAHPQADAAPGVAAGAAGAAAAGHSIIGPIVAPGGVRNPGGVIINVTATMVLLYSWQFTCTGLGTFQDLMQHLDDAMIGTVKQEGHPPIADTGHIPLELRDRAGVVEHVWYRGPLVPENLSRDPLGPYHAADQARRVLPDVAGEDVTYAAAFEVGRLLAMADGRLAQELMRWRTTAYRQVARADTLGHLPIALRAALPSNVVEELHTLIVPVLASNVIGQVIAAHIPSADAYRLQAVQHAVGLSPIALSQAWGISAQSASAILHGLRPSIGGETVAEHPTEPARAPLETAVDDTTLHDTLRGLHDGILADVLTRQGQGKG